MPADPAAVKALFLEAAALDDPAASAALVDERCVADATLRAHVHALLAANDRAVANEGTASFGGADGPDAMLMADSPTREERAGAVIGGKYTLVELIGEGGMGSVWRARQTEPVKRFVAVKLIKAGMDSRQVLARFEAERQALALMDHPNIARVLDGGLHTGRPFFVMELVKGVPITDYCDARKLTLRERLELFVPVCQAIQHAHQKGVIHRDIKPSNVLVALYDDRPVVKVIDFGVAKATGAALTERTIDTGFGGVVGTPQYMSPEQATFNNLDIDTRSDVYALGVLLYELLTGSPPFARKELEKKGLLEILRVVREEEPPRPSTKLSSADALPALSANRGTEPRKLAGLLRNELDWVVMKALEKNLARRYETANALAQDVQRYLAGEAVQAHPPSTAYRLKKVLRRNKGPVLAALLVLLTLIGGIVGTTAGLVLALDAKKLAQAESTRANDERDRAIRAEETALARGRAATAERNRATEKVELAEAVSEFLRRDILSATPYSEAFAGPPGSGMTVTEAVDAAAAKVGQRFVDRPLVEALIRTTLGNTYLRLGKLEKAAAQLEEALRLFRRAKGDEDDAESVRALIVLAWVRLCQGRTNPDLMNESERLHAESVRRAERALPEDNTHRITAYAHCAYCLALQRKFDAAEPLFRRAMALEFKRGETPDLQMVRNNLALMYRLQGRHDEAELLLRQALTEHRRLLGDSHPDTLLLFRNLARVCCDQAKWGEAESFARAALAGARKAWGDRWPEIQVLVEPYQYLSEAAFHKQKPDAHRTVVDELIAVIESRPQALDRNIRTRVLIVGRHAFDLGHFDQSVRLYEVLLRAMRQDEPDSWTTFDTQSLLGGALLGQKKYADAEPLLLSGYEGLKAREKAIPQTGAGALRVPEAIDRLIELYRATNRPDEAKKWLAERARYPTAAPPREKQ